MHPPVEKYDPGRIRKRTPKPVTAMIDEFFASQKTVVEDGKSQRRSAFEIIALQLWNKAMAGNTRASNVMTKYFEFAATRGGPGGFITEWVDDDVYLKEVAGKND
jgi:hypothetical protein